MKKDLNKHIPDNVKLIINSLKENGCRAYVVGGAVRDLLMNKTPKDFDIACDFSPEEVILSLKSLSGYGLKCYATEKEISFGRCTCSIDGELYEITSFREDLKHESGKLLSVKLSNVRSDARRRDFTINGLYYDIGTRTILDFVDGRQDIKKRKLRFIGDAETRIEEDPIRILRYIRFRVTTCLLAAPSDENILEKQATLLESVSRERIREEIDKTFKSLKLMTSGRCLDLFLRCGVFTQIYGEELLADIKSCKQENSEYHPEIELLDHINHVFFKVQILSDPESIDPDLLWCALLHDIGKPFTSKEVDGRTTFYGHEDVSVELAALILGRFGFSKKRKEKILYIIKNHMRISNVKKMKKAKLRKFISDPHFKDLMDFHNADDMVNAVSPDCEFLEKEIKKFGVEIKPLLCGKDLIDAGFKPGKELGAMLRGALTLQLENDIEDKEILLDMVLGRRHKV